MTLALAFLSNFQGTMVFLSLIQGDYFCMVSNDGIENVSMPMVDFRHLTSTFSYHINNR
jgi:hypothetical protein